MELLEFLGLAGERALVTGNTVRFEEDAVRSEGHALCDQDNVADNEPLGAEGDLVPIADYDAGALVLLTLQLLELLLLGVIVARSHKGDDQDGQENGHAVHQTRRSVFDDSDDQRHGGRSHQNLEDGVFEGLGKELADGFNLARFDLVVSVSKSGEFISFIYLLVRWARSVSVPSMPV